MEWIPKLRLGWLNGWVPLVVYAVVLFSTIARMPRHVQKRLFDVSHWTRRQRMVRVVGAIPALALIILLALSPLRIGHPEYTLGGSLYGIGLLTVVVSIINFRDAPLDRPATNGLYATSRNPQSVGLGLVALGSCLAVGSWLALVLLAVAARIYHERVLAEEAACMVQYGDSYRRYMDGVPRYFALS